MHLASAELLDEWAADVPADARRLADAFWPGPLTMILRRSGHVLDEAVDLLEVPSRGGRSSAQRHASPRVVWSISRCWAVKRAKKLSESDGRRRSVL